MRKIIVYVALMISSLMFSQNAFDKLEDLRKEMIYASQTDEHHYKKLRRYYSEEAERYRQLFQDRKV